jgi:hypothetical protein
MARKIYNLHIPRTSGSSVNMALAETFMSKEEHDPRERLLETISNSDYDRFPYLSGHFGTNPIIENPGKFEVFSLIREPISHYLSVAAYTAKATGVDFDNDYLSAYMWEHQTPFGQNELFSASGNIQSKMLFCRIAICDKSVVAMNDTDVAHEENLIFIESDLPPIDKIAERVTEMNIFTVEQRHLATGWLAKRIEQLYGMKLARSIDVVSNSVFADAGKNFTLADSCRSEIVKRSQMDLVLYGIVSSMLG